MPHYILRRCKRNWALVLPVILLLLSSCASQRYYNQRTMFRLSTTPGGQIDSSKLRIAVNRTERNYRIQPNDFLQVRVYTNKGERILDPNGELQFGQPGGLSGSQGSSAVQQTGINRGGSASLRNGGQGGGTQSSGDDFLVQADGSVVLPLLNRIRLTGLSLLQADSVLQVRYREYYKEPFVTTRVTNNRVFVLGAPGGLVIPLQNDNMSLIEVLALAGGIDGGGGSSGSVGGGGGFYRYGGKANSIRIIRGDLKNPRVQQVDLTTLDGMRRANLQMEPNDIIYVEPVHRPVQEALVDAAPIISLSSLLFTTTYFIITLIK